MVATRRSAALWFGLLGAIWGLFLGGLLLALALLGRIWDARLWAISVGIIVFSILGLVGALRVIKRGDMFNAGLMILAGVGILISILFTSPLSVPSALLFFIGAALILLKKDSFNE
jgi:hypothetical protein